MFKKIKRKIVSNILFIRLSFLVQRLKRKNQSKNIYHVDKIEKILAAKKLFNINILVETGTYLGQTINYVKSHFSHIFSIELSELLAEEAKRKFKKHKNVEIIKGDSGLSLSEILKKVQGEKIFWLDAHYSSGITAASENFGNTPILKELEIIFDNWTNGSVILIDDARLFNGKNDYPTIEFLSDYILKKNLELSFFIDKDIIHII